MKIDSLGCVVMEQSSPEGNLGDSCAETARYAHLKMLLGDYVADYDLNQFITPLGFVRHPNSIWREDDMSSDQMLPLLLAIRRNEDARQLIIHSRLSNYHTGNGDIVSPGLFAELVDSQTLRTLFLLGQLLLWKLPYRWSDSKNMFEANEESSADYLNFIHIAVYAPRWLRKRIGPSKLMFKVRDYYFLEHTTLWIQVLYNQVCITYFGEQAK